MRDARWLLPEGIDELLPPEAWRLEVLRRRLLDHFQSWGYELVVTPFLEYLDSLLTGTGRDLELQTFVLTDQLTGRLLGIRADITPQAARIDAHKLRRDCPTRLCYLGSVLRTRAEGLGASRSPLQLGAELYGHSGVESDIEIASLMVAILREAGITDLYLDIGHVGIYRGLARQAQLDRQTELAVFDALQRKAQPEIESLLGDVPIAGEVREMLLTLPRLNGGDEVIAAARNALAAGSKEVMEALEYVAAVAEGLKRAFPDVPLHYDLAELRAYQYQTGVVFAAFVPGEGQEIARGGRYDEIGKIFGRARPATGFSADLKTLARLTPVRPDTVAGRVCAPALGTDIALEEAVRSLRASGSVVIRELPGQTGDAADMGCTERLVRMGDGSWRVEPVE